MVPVEKYMAFRDMLTRALCRLHPEQANRHPALFLLEIAAALLSVLAVRDVILGGPAASFETLSAAALWAMLLAISCHLVIRERGPASR